MMKGGLFIEKNNELWVLYLFMNNSKTLPRLHNLDRGYNLNPKC